DRAVPVVDESIRPASIRSAVPIMLERLNLALERRHPPHELGRVRARNRRRPALEQVDQRIPHVRDVDLPVAVDVAVLGGGRGPASRADVEAEAQEEGGGEGAGEDWKRGTSETFLW